MTLKTGTPLIAEARVEDCALVAKLAGERPGQLEELLNDCDSLRTWIDSVKPSANPFGDHDSAERVELMTSLGATFSEFPMNMQAARAAYDSGVATMFGSPNILRGRSQGGGMRAIDAALAVKAMDRPESIGQWRELFPRSH